MSEEFLNVGGLKDDISPDEEVLDEEIPDEEVLSEELLDEAEVVVEKKVVKNKKK